MSTQEAFSCLQGRSSFQQVTSQPQDQGVGSRALEEAHGQRQEQTGTQAYLPTRSKWGVPPSAKEGPENDTAQEDLEGKSKSLGGFFLNFQACVPKSSRDSCSISRHVPGTLLLRCRPELCPHTLARIPPCPLLGHLGLWCHQLPKALASPPLLVLQEILISATRPARGGSRKGL